MLPFQLKWSLLTGFNDFTGPYPEDSACWKQAEPCNTITWRDEKQFLLHTHKVSHLFRASHVHPSSRCHVRLWESDKPQLRGVVINPVTHLRQLMGVITLLITCSYYLVILVILSLWPFQCRSQQQSDSAVSVENSKTQGLNKCKCRRSNRFKLTLTAEYSLEKQHRPWKMMVRRLLSFWKVTFQGLC